MGDGSSKEKERQDDPSKGREKTVIRESSPEIRRQACSLVFIGTLHILWPCLEEGW